MVVTKEIRCPKCNSVRVTTERRFNGDSVCSDCKHSAPTETFKIIVRER